MSPVTDTPPTGSDGPLRVLLIEDNPADALLVEEHLADAAGAGFVVDVRERVTDGCVALQADAYDCVLTDLGLPDAHGLEVVAQLIASAPDVPIVVLSGRDDLDLALQAVDQGAEDYLPKRLADGELLARAVRHAVQRRRARRALDASERRRQAMLDTAHDAFIAVATDGTIVEWNPAAERMFGWSADEVLGAPLDELILPDEHRAAHRDRRARLLGGGEPRILGRPIELPAVRRDGTTFPVELTVTALEIDGETTYFGFLRDVSERRRAEDALRRSEELYRTLMNNLPGTGAVLFDHELRVVKAEGPLFQDGMWSGEEIEGRTVHENLGDTADLFIAPMRGALRGETHSYEWHTPDRSRIFWSQVVPVVGEGGRITAGLHVSQDITDRRQAERYADVQNAVTQVIASAPDVEHAGQLLLETLVEKLGWDVGMFWRHDAPRDALRRGVAWQRPGAMLDAFVTASGELEIRCGVGLPGQAWLEGRTVLFDDVAGTASAVRSQAAADAELRTGLAIPITSGGRFLGVLELLTRDEMTVDPDGQTLLSGVAHQIGDFLQRKRVERDLAEHAAQIATVAEATRKLSRINDPVLARQTITEATRVVTDASVVLLGEPAEDGRILRFDTVVGRDLPQIDVQLGVEPSGAALAFMTGERIFVADVSASPAVSPRWCATTGACSALFEPVMLEGRPVAALAIIWSEPVAELPARLSSTIALLATEAAATIQRANLLAQLNAAARTDELTQIPNRRRWEEELPRELRRVQRSGDPLSLVLLDIDHFKRFNDTYGHPAGDDLLRRVAQASNGVIRDTDLLARVGGEEFAVLLPGCDGDAAVELADRLRAAMPPGVTCSCGVAVWAAGETVGDLTRRADAALYQAKGAGRDRTVLAAPARLPCA